MPTNRTPTDQTANVRQRPSSRWANWAKLLRRYTVPFIAVWGIVAGLMPLLPLGDSTQQIITDFYHNLPFPIPKSNACLITSAICISYWAVNDLKPVIDDLWETTTTIMFKFKLKPSVVERETAKIRAKVRAEALAEGLAEGHAEGHTEGRAEGHAEGRAEGHAEGLAEGHAEGRAEGRAEGHTEGRAEGHTEGRAEGHAEGRAEGHTEGRAEGAQEQNELWQAWLRRMQDAESQGIEFNEPPPGTTNHTDA